MASSSSMPPPSMINYKNWSELPPELMFLIMGRLDVVDLLENVQKVCRSWRRIFKDPWLWRKIDMGNLQTGKLNRHGFYKNKICDKICRIAVDYSEGGLVEISIGDFCTESLLTYIADRSSNLRSLKLDMSYPMTSDGLVNAVVKLPQLEVLELSETRHNLDLKAIGHSCPRLKTLKLNPSKFKYDDDALRIAKRLLELRRL